MELQQYYINLIVKQLSTPLSEKEEVELAQWLSASEAHQAIAQEYRKAWELCPTEHPQVFQPDVEAAWNKVLGRISIPSEAPAPLKVQVNWTRRLARVAATLTLIAVALWGYQKMTAPADLEITSAAADKMEVKLADGSVVWLRKGATLRYPSVFNNSERRVVLDGEAYFEVAHRSGQRFCIELKRGEKIEVLGTSFNVNPAPEGTIVTVKTGKVRFESDSKEESVIITAGNKAVHRKDTPRIIVETTSTLNDMAWQRGGLEFIQTPVHQVIKDMEAYYQVKIDLESSTVSQCRYNAPLGQLPVDKALENLCTLYNIRLIQSSPGHYILKGGTCS